MNEPHRLKSAKNPGLEGRLTAVAGSEQPDPEAIVRAARRLGVSAAAISALASGVATSSTASAATAGAAGAAQVVTMTATGIGAVKAALIGIGLGVTLAIGTSVVSSKSGGNKGVAISNPVQRRITEKNETATFVSPPFATAAPEPPSSERAFDVAPITGKLPAVSTARALETPAGGLRRAAPTARFDDVHEALPGAPATASVAISGSIPGALDHVTSPIGSAPVTADQRLAREVASLDRARNLANHGSTVAGLQELDAFQQHFGYSTLRQEAMLVRFDVLLALGRKGEAAQIARVILTGNVPAAQRKRLQAVVDDH